MFCPSCQNTLRERERDGVLLDVCPGCGGVWLDRGELEKLTRSERSYYRRDDDDDDDDDDRGRDRRDWPRGEQYEARPPAYEGARGPDPRYDDRRYDERRPEYRSDDRDRNGYTQPRKKKGFLENVFGNLSENMGGGGAMDD